VKVDKMHFRECLYELLTDMFGKDCLPKLIKGDRLVITVDGKTANINLDSRVGILLKVNL
jgi:cleavage and polyadenylation specificity factor subunit 3